jgi:hypothetical protein
MEVRMDIKTSLITINNNTVTPIIISLDTGQWSFIYNDAIYYINNLNMTYSKKSQTV